MWWGRRPCKLWRINGGIVLLARILRQSISRGIPPQTEHKRHTPVSVSIFTVLDDEIPWYDRTMAFVYRGAVKPWIRGVGAVFLLALGHVAHDWFEQDTPLSPSVFASIAILGQGVILSLGYEVVVRKSFSGKKAFIAAVIFSILWGCLVVWLHSPSNINVPWLEYFWYCFAGIGVLAFWLLVYYFPQKLEDAKARVMAAESATAKAELARMRSNLHPHFLLNTLNAVAGLTTSDPGQARQLLGALGDLLRDSLEDSSEMVPLQTEIEWLKRYAQIFITRYAERLSFEWDVDPASTRLMIPRMLLQPLVENAIEHGALRCEEQGTVRVSSTRTSHGVRIDVKDNGPGMPYAVSGGMGLRLVRERLLNVFPEASMIHNAPHPGCSVSLIIPGGVR